VLDPEHDPVAWSTTQLNLANALQYLPSVHQEDNLDEAVQLYEEVLQHRDDRIDPIGVARVLVNQSNALAHLGAFLDAREKLATARELFASRADDEGLAAVAELLAEIDDAETRNAGRTS
jgi:tetratricopeptide (TPR) repeat protein